MLTALSLLLPALAQAGCDVSTHSQVMASTRDAEAAFQDAEPERITAAAESARASIPCVGARLLPEEVAALHRLFAYEAFVRRDSERVSAWFEASRAAQGDYIIPSTVLPARHPLRGLFDGAVPQVRETESLKVRRGEQAYVDGQPREDVPLAHPSLVQIVSPTGVRTFLQANGGAPAEAAPLPSDSVAVKDRSRTVLAVGLSGVTANHDDGPWGYGGPHVRAHVPLGSGALHAEAMLQLPMTAAEVAVDGGGTERAVLGLPMAQLGVVGRASGEAIMPWGGAGLLILSDVDGPMAGAGAGVGVDVPLGALLLTPELRAGWTTGPRLGGMPLFGVGIGAGASL